MDVRKTNLAAEVATPSTTDTSTRSESATATNAALANALSLIGAFSNKLFLLSDQESIREHAVSTVKGLLGVESVHFFFHSSESSEDSIQKVFETGNARVRNRVEGGAEIAVAIRGASGVLAVIRAADRTDWTPFTANDVAVLESLGVQRGL